MTQPVAALRPAAEGHQVLQVVAPSIMQRPDVVDFDTAQALAFAILALVAVPDEHSSA